MAVYIYTPGKAKDVDGSNYIPLMSSGGENNFDVAKNANSSTSNMTFSLDSTIGNNNISKDCPPDFTG